MLKTGVILENRYRLVGQMASGGFADIYVGCDLRLGNKPVIIKMLRRDFSEDRERIQMFLDEINLTTRLDHENIVRVYDVIRMEDNTYVQILELVEGLDFAQIISEAHQRNERIPFNLVAYVLSKVCLALDYAHEKRDTSSGDPLNIVHRDISPSNILVSYDGKVKLTDFGIAFAHLHQRQKTRMGELKGKIAYMSPEQVRGKRVDRQSDLYSLGIVFYESLTSRRLFDGDSEIEVLQMVAEGEIDYKSIEDAGVPPDLRKVLEKALQKNVNERYRSSFEIFNDLQKYLSNWDEYSLRSRLKDYISGLKKETRLTQLLGILKGEIQEEPDLELTLPPKGEEEEKGEEKTIYDLIRVQTGGYPKIWKGLGLSLLVATFAFAGIDTFFLQKTPVGRRVHNKIFPPSLVIETLPEGAQVRFEDRLRKGATPLTLSRIQAGTYNVSIELEGYKPIKRTITVEEKGKDNSNDPPKFFFSFEIPLSIRSNPPGAKIFFNQGEQYSEPTPVSISYPLQKEPLGIRLEQSGFKAIETSLNLLENPSNPKDRIWKISRIKDEAGLIHYNLLGNFYAEVTVTSIPENALITILHDGEASDPLPTPVTLFLSAGKNLLKGEKEGWIPWMEEVTVEN